MASSVNTRSLPHPSAVVDLSWLRRLELLFYLVWRDLKVRYRRTVIGAGWAVLQPLSMMAVISVFFGRLANIDSGGVPYPVLSLSGLVPWYFFSNGFSQASSALQREAGILNKVYFPREIPLLASLCVGLIDLSISGGILMGFVYGAGFFPGWRFLSFVFFIPLLVSFTLGLSLWFSILSSRMRDLNHVQPLLVQLGFFLSPIAYPISLVPSQWRAIYALNPMVGVICGFRWALFGSEDPIRLVIVVSSLSAVIIFFSGWLVFKKLEPNIVDYL